MTEVCSGYKSDLIGNISCYSALPNIRGRLRKRSFYSDKERTCILCTECDWPLVKGEYQRTHESTHICSLSIRRVMLEPVSGPQTFCQYRYSKVWRPPDESEWARIDTNADSVHWKDDNKVVYNQW